MTLYDILLHYMMIIHIIIIIMLLSYYVMLSYPHAGMFVAEGFPPVMQHRDQKARPAYIILCYVMLCYQNLCWNLWETYGFICMEMCCIISLDRGSNTQASNTQITKQHNNPRNICAGLREWEQLDSLHEMWLQLQWLPSAGPTNNTFWGKCS